MRLTEDLKIALGDKTAKPLAETLELQTVSDLIRHYPRAYKENKTDLGDLVVGEHVTFVGAVKSARSIPMRNRAGTRQEVIVTDGRRSITLVFFKQEFRLRQMHEGSRGLFSGDVTEFNGKLQLAHPDFYLIGADTEAGELPALLPVYPASAKVRSWDIQKSMQVLLPQVELGEDALPAGVRSRNTLMDQDLALEGIHRPESWAHLGAARKRLKWDEAFALQVSLAQRRRAAMSVETAARNGKAGGLRDLFTERLPFELTAGQQVILQEILTDLAQSHPMHRLLQGEVGSGKTVVALIAMLSVIDSGGQAALLAPTEVLAQQHYRSITGMLGPLGQAGMLGGADVATSVALLTGSMGTKAKRQAMLDAQSGTAGIVIGTHALIEERVGFADLGLIIVDEQHRFGVKQRDALRLKASTPPHVLVMTATPIPRTVAMTVFGDLETSTLRELPRGRTPIASHVVHESNPQWIERMWQRIREETAAGHQAYIVFPRIGEGTKDDDAPDAELVSEDLAEAAARAPLALLEHADALADGPLQGLRVGTLHGRMAGDAKDAAMTAFSRGELDVLLATTVIEVGVDVPNATVMVIMDSERFGISQLHQLRGRVGRGTAPSWCLLHTNAHPESPALERINAVAASNDGFELANVDLDQRREGDILGERQSGTVKRLKLLSLRSDEEIIREARDEAVALIHEDPDLQTHPALAALVASLVNDEAAEFLERG